MSTHTTYQLRNFERYEQVRSRGLYNMYDPRARKATGLDFDDYVYVMQNYKTLRDQAAAAITKAVQS